MDLVSVVLALVVLGVVWWLVTTYIPMPAPIKTIITVILVLALCLWLLSLTGVGRLKIGG